MTTGKACQRISGFGTLFLAVALLLAGCNVSKDETAPAPSSSSPSPTWEGLYEQVNSGVVRVTTIDCDSRSVGSGFLVAGNRAVTAAHVVDGASYLSVRAGVQVSGAEVVALDRASDVAVLRLTTPVAGHVFDWASTSSAVGDDIAVIGYPLGNPLSMSKGAVSATDRRVEVDDRDMRGLLQLDASVNPGNSGGPVVNLDGAVVGVVEAGSSAAGDAYATTSAVAQAAGNGQQGTLAAGSSCSPATQAFADGDQPTLDVNVSSTHPEAPDVALTLRMHADAINNGDYEAAWSLLTASVRRRIGSLEQYRQELASSFWISLDVVDVQPVDDTTDDVSVNFRTVQDPKYGKGMSCSDWTMRYRMIIDNGGLWQIDRGKEIVPRKDCSADYDGWEPGD